MKSWVERYKRNLLFMSMDYISIKQIRLKSS